MVRWAARSFYCSTSDTCVPYQEENGKKKHIENEHEEQHYGTVVLFY